jgi:hypothetical protein
VPVFLREVILIGYRADDDKIGPELSAKLLQLVKIRNADVSFAR